MSHKVNIRFLGAAGTVTGSKYLLEIGSKKILIDCGLFQGLKNLRLKNWAPLPLDSSDLDAVILTHAHIDHSGYLPLLVKNGFCGPIYCTHATKVLCGILLPDAGYLQEEEARFANRHNFSKHHPALPLYTKEDAIHCLEYFRSVNWHEDIEVCKGVNFRALMAGHILGSAIIQIKAFEHLITFSGDLGRQHPLMLLPPESVSETDTLVVESTYGSRKHPHDDPKMALKNTINKTIQRGGILIIPAFAVGRTQDLLSLIHDLKKSKLIPDIPVYINSPMAIKSTRIYSDHLEDQALTPQECEEHCKVATYVSTPEESKALALKTEPAIIISASGMASGGRVLHHLKALAPDPKNTILLVGYQAAGTRGEALLHRAETIKIHGQKISVRAEIVTINSLSAHADADEIMTWLGHFKKSPKMTFITHGEPLESEALRIRIQEELRWNAMVPEMGQMVTLSE